MIPDAAPDDGLLDVYVASPHRITHWFRVFLRLITRRRHGDDKVDQWRGQRVEVRLREPDNYQLDGDVVGEMHTLVAEVQPGALTICVPSEQSDTATTPDPRAEGWCATADVECAGTRPRQ